MKSAISRQAHKAVVESRAEVHPDAPRSSGIVSTDLSWRALPGFTRMYLTAVIAGGLSALGAFFPHTFPEPIFVQ